jgi:thymidylate synthase
MDQYLNLMGKIRDKGLRKENRTGIDTISLFAETVRFPDVGTQFPLITTKKMYWKGIVAELLWMISGGRNIRSLVLQGVNIWNEWPLRSYLRSIGQLEFATPGTPAWNEAMSVFVENIKADEEFANQWGDLGPVYGYQWRHWVGNDGLVYDQLGKVIDTIKSRPSDRRMVVSAWNVPEIPAMEISGLPPCHYTFQFLVQGDALCLSMTQRSADVFLGLPFNIASYALLLILVAHVTGYKAGDLAIHTVDSHLYVNHLEAVEEQLSRKPLPLPTVQLNPDITVIDHFEAADIKLIGYQSHPAIKGVIAV